MSGTGWLDLLTFRSTWPRECGLRVQPPAVMRPVLPAIDALAVNRVEHLSRFQPPYSPWQGCAEHRRCQPGYRFRRHRFFSAAQWRRIPRLRCRASGRTFSRQAFAVSCYRKRPELLRPDRRVPRTTISVTRWNNTAPGSPRSRGRSGRTYCRSCMVPGCRVSLPAVVGPGVHAGSPSCRSVPQPLCQAAPESSRSAITTAGAISYASPGGDQRERSPAGLS
jgi:hypothetical protein